MATQYHSCWVYDSDNAYNDYVRYLTDLVLNKRRKTTASSEDSAKRQKKQKENRIIFAPRLNTQDDRDELDR